MWTRKILPISSLSVHLVLLSVTLVVFFLKGIALRDGGGAGKKEEGRMISC